MKMKPEVRGIGSVAKKGTPVRKIATRNDLLEWLFETLDQLEPRIAVEDDIIGAKEEILETLCEDERFDFPPLYWPDIFSFVRWTEQANLRLNAAVWTCCILCSCLRTLTSGPYV